MVLWWIGNVVLLVVVAPLVVVLAQRVIRLVREIDRYGVDIHTHAAALGKALEPVPELVTTRERVATAKAHAVGYATALQQALA